MKTVNDLALGNRVLLSALICLMPPAMPAAWAEEYLPGIRWPKPALVTPGKQDSHPPSDAVVLFDGKDMSAWEILEGPKTTAGIWYADAKVRHDGADLDQQTANWKWQVKEGAMIIGTGGIRTKQRFGDCQVHLEWSAPKSAKGKGQGRGNSGLFLMGRYEIQILDSYDNDTYFDGQAGAIYKQQPPLVNAIRPPGEWNTYDIVWTRPRFHDDGSLKSPAYITAIHNGVLIQNHFELAGTTPYNRAPDYDSHHDKMPLGIQSHGNSVRFRNIWVRELKPIIGQRVSEPMYRHGDKLLPASEVEIDRILNKKN